MQIKQLIVLTWMCAEMNNGHAAWKVLGLSRLRTLTIHHG